MEDYNSNVGENDNKISIAEIKSAVDKFLSRKPEKQKLSPKDIFAEVLSKLEPVDFLALAEVASERKMQQRHYIVISVDQILKTVREEMFDLARKDAFVLVYNGEYWSAIDTETLKNFLRNAAIKLGVNILEAKYYDFIERLYKQFLRDAHFESFEQDSEKVLVNFKNGTFEIDENTQKLREFRVSDSLTYQLPFEYDETAKAPIFHAFLNKVLPEKELQDILSEFFAYAFIRHLKLERAGLFYGPGANGKSVIFELAEALYGRENIANFSLSNLMEEHNRALIANKLLNYGSEINASTTKDIFKNLVSGEPIQARLKYGNSFLMKNYAKLCFNCNELPRDIEQSHAYFRRLLIIPFRVTIPEKEQDKELAQKIIKNELPGVFNWVLEGLQRLLENKKFTESRIVEAEIDAYRKYSDSVAIFLEETNLVRHATKTLLLKDIYAAYKEFCHADGYKSLNKMNFSKRLQNAHGYLLERKNSGNNIYCEFLRNNAEGNLETATKSF